VALRSLIQRLTSCALNAYTINAVLVVVSALTVVINIRFYNENKILRSQLELQQEVKVGELVQSVEGYDFGGHKISISPLRHDLTVLMIFSPTCHYCEQNWPKWNSVVKNPRHLDVAFILVDITGNASLDFEQSHLGGSLYLHQIAPEIARNLQLRVTPETIVIGRDGRVKGAWSEVLSSSAVEAIGHMM